VTPPERDIPETGADSAAMDGHDIRKRLEERERQTLAPYACFSSVSRGRPVSEPEDPHRMIFQRDRDRIIHTKAFRRLKRKTQVFLAPQGDHYRTRLTHTLEVAQIARTIARALSLNEDLTEAIALGHDLGHTPFGHAGEVTLNELYAPGFKHAEQSLRVVDKLEKRPSGRGLNLSIEVRDGILNHSKGKALLHNRPVETPATLEGVVVSVSDAIAYISHDVDDAIRAGIITEKDLPADAVTVLGNTTSDRIDRMVVGMIKGSADGKLGIVPEIREAMNALRDYLYVELYPCAAINDEIRKAKNVVREIYLRLLAQPMQDLIEGDPADSLERRAVDFVAGMTDEYALALFTRMVLPAPWKG